MAAEAASPASNPQRNIRKTAICSQRTVSRDFFLHRAAKAVFDGTHFQDTT
jgi:hypothetical protein